jgi:tRNA(Arg) A34 adenosine deaminase TadA
MTDAAERPPVGDSPEVDADRGFMRAAIEAARRALLAGEPPIGACVVRDGQIIARAHNAVIGSLDITAHAEIQAIRVACREERALDLSGSRLFVTVEPCPMCLAACHYAHISEVVFGAQIEDLHRATGDELLMSGSGEAEGQRSAVRVRGGLLADDCRALLAAWTRQR